jgi:hypothetical protein
MTREGFDLLAIGDIVRNKGSGNAYVAGRYGDCVIAVRTVEMTNPAEWDLVFSRAYATGGDYPEQREPIRDAGRRPPPSTNV